jgi:alkylation response protein AidB-like acyl-CoA dehydrogenase
MSFDPDLSDPLVAKAVELRDVFAKDAVARDKRGGRPIEQVRLLKESGLLSIQIAKEHGGAGASWLSVLRAVREFARVDGSLGHIYGYHFLPINILNFRGTAEQKGRLLGRSAQEQWFWGNSGNPMSKSLFGRLAGDEWVIDGYRPFSSGTHVADYMTVAWEDVASGERTFAAIPASYPGVEIKDDWDGIGQRQTGSGTVTFDKVRIARDEVLSAPVGTPFTTLIPLIQQSVLLNVFVGSAQGALTEGRAYTVGTSRPWVDSGVARHTDDPWVKRHYGELFIKTKAATELADMAARSFDAAWARGSALTAEERGRAAIDIAAANVVAGEVGLDVSSRIFEVTGARSAVNAYGFDRFWRNVRTHTLHNPAEYKARTVGAWFLTGEFPEPDLYR